NIDIIPDIIGWVMIIISLECFEDFGINKSLVSGLSVVMIVFNIIGFIPIKIIFFTIMISFLSTIFSIVIFNELFTIAAKIAEYMGDHSRAQAIKSCLKVYIVMSAIIASLGGGLIIVPIVFGVAIVIFVVSIVMLYHLSYVMREAQAYSDGR
ncbi:MAG: hypothetical protein K6F17_04250, partial [Lachnospiraceae bacterium]|nr:hypothetical protein [Lachnospiraceae bacterium]